MVSQRGSLLAGKSTQEGVAFKTKSRQRENTMGIKRSNAELRKIASIYKTRKEFQKHNKLAYQAAYRRGLDFLDDICSHMTLLYKRWNDTELRNIALQYHTRSAFENGNPNAYRACLSRGLSFMDSVCNHMSDQLITWNDVDIGNKALEFSTRSEFRNKCPKGYSAAIRFGILEEVCAHMSYQRTYWTKEALKKEARLYNHRGRFAVQSASACEAARRLGKTDFDEICKHMTDAPGVSDADVVYVWKVRNISDLYKIGVTSSRLGISRIVECSRDSGYEYDIISYVNVGINRGFDVEALLLRIGKPFIDQKFNGYSEFRQWTNADLIDAMSILEKGDTSTIHT